MALVTARFVEFLRPRNMGIMPGSDRAFFTLAQTAFAVKLQ